jgi:hypothetical protein
MLTCENPGVLSTLTTSLTAARWGSIARSWIRTSSDQAIPVSGQDINIAELDEDFPAHPFDVVTLKSGHMPFLSRADQPARAIHEAAI